MGNCASCLGLGRHRHPSQDREIDRLLSSDSARAAYGTVDHGSLAQPDEEELRREREALEHITAHAADHMIDVIHPSQSDLDYGMADHKHDSSADNTRAGENPRAEDVALDTEDPDAAAWLESIQSAQLEAVQVPKRGALVMDINLLRDSHPSQRGTRVESGV